MSNWRNLDPDEPIGVVALSGPIDPVKLGNGLKVLRRWGNPLELAPNIDHGDDHGYLAGADDDRLAGLDELLHRGVRTFIAARGGYGLTRVMDRLPWSRLIGEGTRFVGFSDLTALLNPLASSTVQIHGPMVAAGFARPDNSRRLLRMLRGECRGEPLFSFERSRVLRHGKGAGMVRGGNLSLMVSLMGTPWEVDLEGSVLMLEEVAEPPYRLDRMLTQLAHSKGFDGVTALVSGRLHACRPRVECAKVWSERLFALAPEGVPIVTGLPFGHGADNRAFPIGATVVVDTERGEVIWKA